MSHSDAISQARGLGYDIEDACRDCTAALNSPDLLAERIEDLRDAARELVAHANTILAAIKEREPA